MSARLGRKATLAALVAAGLALPVLAQDALRTTQQTIVGQLENAAQLDNSAVPVVLPQIAPPVVVKQSYATETNGLPSGEAPVVRKRADRPTTVSSLRPSSTAYYRAPSYSHSSPLILGIRN
jgi:hypothetical protein